MDLKEVEGEGEEGKGWHVFVHSFVYGQLRFAS